LGGLLPGHVASFDVPTQFRRVPNRKSFGENGTTKTPPPVTARPVSHPPITNKPPTTTPPHPPSGSGSDPDPWLIGLDLEDLNTGDAGNAATATTISSLASTAATRGVKPTRAPVTTGSVVAAFYAARSAPKTRSADLVVEEIRMIERATINAGPTFRVKFGNWGRTPAGPFRIGIFAAVDGKLTDPKVVVDVAGLAAGQSSEVILPLPRTPSLTAAVGGCSSGLDNLAVWIDADRQVGRER
jgi:hypothetical protein